MTIGKGALRRPFLFPRRDGILPAMKTATAICISVCIIIR
jgi:hypothetical protein